MQVIVPLAGPDFVRSDSTVKAMTLLDGLPMLRRALESRPWWISGQVASADFVFVIPDLPPARAFASTSLHEWYPAAKIVTLSAFTRGAAFSALAGLSMVAEQAGPICIDLADIVFDSDFNPVRTFADPVIGAAVPCFPSTNEAYSYLRTENNRVVEAAEKRVISSDASAGVYFFASTGVYLRALAHCLADPGKFTHNGLFFVCPLINGVVAQGLETILPGVSNVLDVKTAV